ncbi:hypothetical protein DD237_007651 [Peronospora effusa]|uniref:Uncharacterized protein n=1 Tax=Peronospora effusa TaxID=542832 RepID=A0A3R7W2R2_9STRA|nr:hypothetical protein DD237_007651 [Peronospora effusa]
MSEAFVAIFPFLADHLKGDDLNQLNRALNKHLYLLANREKDATEVFKLLGLHLTNGKCFESPLYSKWIAFVRLRYHDKTEAFVAMFPALADHLMGSDLAELKGELKSQLNVWATKDGQDVAEIFKLLKLHLTDGKVVESPLYTEWFEFVREKYGDDTKAFVAMFPVLADHLKDDELAKLLVVGLTLDLTKESAAKRLNERAEELVKEWVDNSKDAAYVFELLELHLRKNYNILLQESLEERPLVTLWEKFVQEKSVEKEKVVLMLNRFYNKANGLPKVHVAGMQMNNAKIDESRMIQLSTKADFLKDPSTPKFYNWL